MLHHPPNTLENKAPIKVCDVHLKILVIFSRGSEKTSTRNNIKSSTIIIIESIH
jgi:hypothetical protein